MSGGFPAGVLPAICLRFESPALLKESLSAIMAYTSEHEHATR
jgi:hypothetical protein